jgi:tetratricopeptide (TPR) repeat protein
MIKRCLGIDGGERLSESSMRALSDDLDRLDELSERAWDLNESGRHEKALEVCRLLVEEYPDQVDGLHRFGETYAAMGRHAEAADYFRRTAEHLKGQGVRDRATLDHWLEQAAKQDKLGG